MLMKTYIYAFSEGSKELKNLLGGKGANLAEMKRIGLPVPDGFTLTTEACKAFYADGEQLSKQMRAQIDLSVNELEHLTGKQLGGEDQPLLVSVRSGAPISMPGMMDTILNLGLNDVTVVQHGKLTGNERFAYDCYRRFIMMYADVVCEVERYKFDQALEVKKRSEGVDKDFELSSDALKTLCEEFKGIYLQVVGEEFPQDPKEQLLGAIEAVFSSWNNDRALIYRSINKIPDDLGTAVNIQAMVFGNMGATSGTGVAFTRNPSTGEHRLYGEFLMNAQGEDVVAGVRTPVSIEELAQVMPHAYEELYRTAQLLESHYGDMQDIEFTIENKKLYLLQTRTGKRTAHASLKIAVDMVEEGVLDVDDAILRIDANSLNQVLHPTFGEEALAEAKVLAKGLPASPGAAVGRVCFNASEVASMMEDGEPVLLVRKETSPEDIEGMVNASGILTSRGGMTSHAAVVARGMGKCCIAGCSDLLIDERGKTISMNGLTIHEGEYLSLNGSTGIVYLGKLAAESSSLSQDFTKMMRWADQRRHLGVRANADTPRDVKQAIEFGAEGIGLCRTEHMFFDEERISHMRSLILSSTNADRRGPLGSLKKYQKNDFIGIFEAAGTRPVTIRLLDPPLHEFLPSKQEDIEALSVQTNHTVGELEARIKQLHEFNPMLGHRGCRLGVTFPEIYEMQVEAIVEAACHVFKQDQIRVHAEIMIPLVGHMGEFKEMKKLVKRVIDDTLIKERVMIDFSIGTMIEVPRATLIADQLADESDFFSFGTNDLTQMTMGFSRDDAGVFITDYIRRGILSRDPFQTIDQEGVGALMKVAIDKGRGKKPTIKIGICGEHGGEPESINFCHQIGLDYVSCSPFRVPIARFASAQAAIRNK